jgi:hypothetical protein
MASGVMGSVLRKNMDDYFRVFSNCGPQPCKGVFKARVGRKTGELRGPGVEEDTLLKHLRNLIVDVNQSLLYRGLKRLLREILAIFTRSFREYNITLSQSGIGSWRFLRGGQLLFQLWRSAGDCAGVCGLDG